jgi:Bacterial PH domain
VADTAQRFVVHAERRKFARFAGYPAGLFLVVAAIFIPADDPIKFIAALFGLPILMWSWSVDRRRRIEVTEQNVTVVNVFSRHEVPWSELTDIEIDVDKNDNGTDYYLAFVTPNLRIRANMPYDNGDELSKVRARILEAREPLAHHRGGWLPKRPDDPETVAPEVQGAVTDQLERRPRTVRHWLLLAFGGAFAVFLGLPALFALVLDALAGDWLIEHVPIWDEFIGFYDWLFEHAS